MPTDLSLPLRKAILTHLENDPFVTSIVPADRIYGISVPSQPVWPFIRYGVPINIGYEASCWDGTESTVTIHAFAETTQAEAGEDIAMKLSQAIVNSMVTFKPTTLALIDNIWATSNILRDEAEADKFHAVIEFSIIAVTKH